MKYKFFFMALSAMALATGCSNDETTDLNPGDAITFSAVTNSPTRTTATTTNSISAFKTYAYYKASDAATSYTTFMDGVTVSKEGSTWSTPSTYFWPNDGSLDFYSVAPTDITVTQTVSGTNYSYSIEDFEVPYLYSSQKDLIYAVNKGETRAAHEASAVEVNFRHALSQIVFKAKNTNEKLKVQIDGVRIAFVKNNGTYTLPVSETATWLEEDVKSTSEATGSQGAWTLDDTKTYYTAGITSYTLNGKVETAVDLTTSDGSLFLLPQSLTAWDRDNDVNNNKLGAMFLVKCRIWGGDNLDTELWPNAGGASSEVAIPVEINWLEGYKYTYTFVFGEGSGYVPPTPDPDPTDPEVPEDPDPDPTDPDPDPENPSEPVLVPITFTVTVDEFQSADNVDVDMKTVE